MKCSRNSFRDPVKRRPRLAGSMQTKHHLHLPASMWPTSPGRAATSRDTPDVPWGGVEPAQACRFLSRTVVILSHQGLGVVCYVATDALQSQTASKACQLHLLNILTLPSLPFSPNCPHRLPESSSLPASTHASPNHLLLCKLRIPPVHSAPPQAV